MSSMYPGSDGMSSRRTSMGGAQEGARVIGGEDNMSGPGPDLMTADTLIGDTVMNGQGEKLGKIEDIMLDVRRGRIAYAVLASGGVLGLGEKLFAVPWAMLTLDADRECFVLDVDKDRLQEAPGFDKDHWPAMGDPMFASQVHGFYGARPYWE